MLVVHPYPHLWHSIRLAMALFQMVEWQLGHDLGFGVDLRTFHMWLQTLQMWNPMVASEGPISVSPACFV